MIEPRRFGTRLVLPSTAQIIHELRISMGAEAVRQRTVLEVTVKGAAGERPNHADTALS